MGLRAGLYVCDCESRYSECGREYLLGFKNFEGLHELHLFPFAELFSKGFGLILSCYGGRHCSNKRLSAHHKFKFSPNKKKSPFITDLPLSNLFSGNLAPIISPPQLHPLGCFSGFSSFLLFSDLRLSFFMGF